MVCSHTFTDHRPAISAHKSTHRQRITVCRSGSCKFLADRNDSNLTVDFVGSGSLAPVRWFRLSWLRSLALRAGLDVSGQPLEWRAGEVVFCHAVSSRKRQPGRISHREPPRKAKPPRPPKRRPMRTAYRTPSAVDGDSPCHGRVWRGHPRVAALQLRSRPQLARGPSDATRRSILDNPFFRNEANALFPVWARLRRSRRSDRSRQRVRFLPSRAAATRSTRSETEFVATANRAFIGPLRARSSRRRKGGRQRQPLLTLCNSAGWRSRTERRRRRRLPAPYRPMLNSTIPAMPRELVTAFVRGPRQLA